jgi:hypothetical protein
MLRLILPVGLVAVSFLIATCARDHDGAPLASPATGLKQFGGPPDVPSNTPYGSVDRPLWPDFRATREGRGSVSRADRSRQGGIFIDPIDYTVLELALGHV